MILFAALIALAQPAAPPAGLGEDPAAILVRNFLHALERDERGAQAMLADNATMGMGDVGGPLTASVYAAMMRDPASHCRLTRLERDPRPFPMPGRTIAIVAGHYRCVPGARPEGHVLRIDYLVEGGKIAGIYIGAGGGPHD